MSIPSFEEKFKYLAEKYEKEHSCRCPFCGYDLNTESEDMIDLITYWGEDGRKEESCNSCGKDFWVEEKVDRTWNVFKTEDEEEEF